MNLELRGGRIGHLVSRWWFWALLIAFFFAYPIYRSLNRILPPELPIITTLPQFRLTSENNTPFGSVDLKGRVYMANFIFTRCPSVCPKMMEEMAQIQKRVRGTGQKVALVTFTVDPEHDTPEVLFDKARETYKANPHMWSFLTSSDKEALFKLYRDGFLVNVADREPLKDLYDIAHSEKIVLVDQIGRVRGYYNYDKDSVNQLMIDVGLLINRPVTKE
jgi:protein SCO1/2